MNLCESIRPLLGRVAEREADPREAIEVARHVAVCTGCRIRFARERRLAEMLETELSDLPVGDGFVDEVMARIPADPPRRSRRRRGLKLAVLAGLLSVPGSLLVRLSGDAALGGDRWSLPWTGMESLASSSPAWSGWGGAVRMALETVTALLPALPAGLSLHLEWIAALLAATLLICAGAASMLSMLAWAAGSWLTRSL